HRPGTRRAGSKGSYTRADIDSWYSSPSLREGAGGREASARGPSNIGRLTPDEGASYAIELELDLSTVVPHIYGPNDVKTMVSLPEIESKKVKINKAWLMSCVNARFEDLAAAATIVKGKKVAQGVE